MLYQYFEIFDKKYFVNILKSVPIYQPSCALDADQFAVLNPDYIRYYHNDAYLGLIPWLKI